MHNAISHCITKNISHASARQNKKKQEREYISISLQTNINVHLWMLSQCGCMLWRCPWRWHGPSHNAPGWAGEYPAEWSWGWWAHTVTFGPVSRMFLHIQMCSMNCGRCNIHLISLILQIMLTRWWCTTRMFCWTWLMSVLRTRLLSQCAIISPVWMIHTSGVGGASDTWFSIIKSWL